MSSLLIAIGFVLVGFIVGVVVGGFYGAVSAAALINRALEQEGIHWLRDRFISVQRKGS